MRASPSVAERTVWSWGQPGRFGVYGLLGYAIEVCFTAGKDLVTGKGDVRLRGESFVWMAPIYGAGGLTGEAISQAMGNRPVWQRAAMSTLRVLDGRGDDR